MNYFNFKSHRQYLTFWFITISSIPLILSFLIVYFQRRDYLQQSEITKLEAIRDFKVREINNWFDGNIAAITAIAKNSKIIDYALLFNKEESKEKTEEFLHQLCSSYLDIYPSFREIFVIDAYDQKIKAGSNNASIGIYCGFEKFYSRPVNTGKIYIEDIYRQKNTGQVEMLFSIPVFDEANQNILAVMTIKINPHATLYPLMLDRTGMGKTGETLIVNKDVMALSELRWYPNAPLNLKIKANPAVKAAIGMTNFEYTIDYRGEPVLSTYTYIEQAGWGLVAKQDLTELDEPLRQLFINFIILFLISFILIYLIARVLAGTISKPLMDMAFVSKQLGEGKLDVRNNFKSDNEIGQLANSINIMADSLTSQYKVQQGTRILSETLILSKNVESFWSQLALKIVEISSATTCVCYMKELPDKKFHPRACIGINKEMINVFDAEELEGEIGRVILLKDIVYLEDIDLNTKTFFKTAYINFRPKEIISIPVIVDMEVVAVISISKIKPFDKECLEILRHSMPVINTSYSGLLSKNTTEQLAARLTENNRTLNENRQILQQKNEEMMAQQSELMLQSQELQSQNIELQMQSKQVEEANRLKSEFLSNMSHELRTPLNSIMALSRVLIMQGQGKLGEEEKGYLEIIERNGKSLLHLINSILDLSKIESGKMDFSVRKFSLSNTIKIVIENISKLAHEKGLQIITNINASLSEIESDEYKVQQIIQNIMGNAIKYTEKGQILITADYKDDNVQISIEDTGIGIPSEALQYIFDEFRQVDGSTSRKYEGSGLGLSIAKKTVRLLGGDIFVKSLEGKGSVFTIVLPVLWRKTLKGNELFKMVPSKERIKNQTILVIDDEPVITRLISECLEKEGYQTIETNNGKEAIDLANKHLPFAITLDLMMPDMDGWEVLQQLKSNEKTSGIPVVIVSIAKEIEAAIVLGAVGYVSKPLDKMVLIDEIKKISMKKGVQTILIVDDNEFERNEIKKYLQHENYSIFEAANGKECIEKLSFMNPDIIILDLIMPELDGFETIKYLQSNDLTSDIPIIIVSAKDLSPTERMELNKKTFSILGKNKISLTRTIEEIKFQIGKIKDKFYFAPSPYKNRLLIVEDNDASIIQLKFVLESAGYIADIAKSGKNAILYLQENIPDGIILDLMMPEMDGFQLLEQIKELREIQNIPVLILTAKNLTAEDLKVLSDRNIQQLIQKGDINRDELLFNIGIMLKSAQTKELNSNHNYSGDAVKAIENNELINPPLKKILMIEDNPDNIATLLAILKNRFIIIYSTEGIDGYNLACTENPDLILLDVMLPGISGIEILKRIKQNDVTSKIPVIAVTAQAMKGIKEKLLQSGFDDYLSKPIDPLILIEKINGLIYKNRLT